MKIFKSSTKKQFKLSSSSKILEIGNMSSSRNKRKRDQNSCAGSDESQVQKKVKEWLEQNQSVKTEQSRAGSIQNLALTNTADLVKPMDIGTNVCRCDSCKVRRDPAQNITTNVCMCDICKAKKDPTQNVTRSQRDCNYPSSRKRGYETPQPQYVKETKCNCVDCRKIATKPARMSKCTETTQVNKTRYNCEQNVPKAPPANCDCDVCKNMLPKPSIIPLPSDMLPKPNIVPMPSDMQPRPNIIPLPSGRSEWNGASPIMTAIPLPDAFDYRMPETNQGLEEGFTSLRQGISSEGRFNASQPRCSNNNFPSQCSTCGRELPYIQGEFHLDYLGFTLVKVKYLVPKNGLESLANNLNC